MSRKAVRCSQELSTKNWNFILIPYYIQIMLQLITVWHPYTVTVTVCNFAVFVSKLKMQWNSAADELWIGDQSDRGELSQIFS